MRKSLIVWIVILIVVVVGIAWYISWSSSTAPVEPMNSASSTPTGAPGSTPGSATGAIGSTGASGTTGAAGAVSASIDAASLNSGSSKTILTGSASGLSAVYVEIDGMGDNLSSYGPGSASVVNGHWSLSVGPSALFGGTYVNGGLPPGSYKVIVWSSLGLGSAQEMAHGTLVVSGTPAPVPSANHTGTTFAGAGLTLTGTANNTNSVTVALVPMTYSGSPDWNSIVASSQFQHLTVPVKYVAGVGEWTASFQVSGRSYYPYVFEPGSQLLLAHGADSRDQIVLP